MAHRLSRAMWCAVWVLSCASLALAQGRGGGGPAAAGGVSVLDTYSFWRLHHTLRPPMFQGSDGLKPALLPQGWLNLETAPPQAGWRDPNFDDTGWFRSTAPTVCRTPYLARLCMRGKFLVSDPGRVRGLTLTVNYAGGAAAWLNGKLLAADRVADSKAGWEFDDKAAAKPLTGLAIPANLLQRGVNVLAIEVVRPPFAGAVAGGKDPSYTLSADTCAVDKVQLAAPSADGLAPNASRPPGLQAWNSNVLASDSDLDWATRRSRFARS